MPQQRVHVYTTLQQHVHVHVHVHVHTIYNMHVLYARYITMVHYDGS